MLTLFLAVLAISSESSAQAPAPPRENRYEIRGEFSYFASDSNYGSGAQIPDGGEFTNALTAAQVFYDLTSDFRAYGGATYGWTKADDGYESRTHAGFSELSLGSQYWFRLPRLYLVPQGDFVMPAFRVDEYSEDALIGDGAMRIRGGGWAILRLGPVHPFSYLGFEYQDEGRARLLHYNAGLQFKPKNYWLQAEFHGYQTVIDDSDSDLRQDRDLYLHQVDGGSYRFYALNPSVSEAAVSGGFNIGPIGAKAGLTMTVAGNNSAAGWTAFVGVSFSPVPDPIQRRDDDHFEFKTEEYDKSLFKEGREISPNDGHKRKIRKKVRKKPAIDKLLQDTQKELEGN
jgi:hypothetical protein